ncbi:PREDICTED: uncharacterized protein LOC106810608 isoform X2 [Priapulus caudatus]|uniref:Uncharacterized protein LOC106810608 isoform X2 n=1 Tax=Priapulus caudatus TaxID=37621 RepID=A0ABM1EBE4_PRICU|nr:PREDICTED: uncharacterized protein LOC106810608 isoform X2 [Priapulus caudatus]
MVRMDIRSDLFLRLRRLEGLIENPTFIPNHIGPSGLLMLTSTGSNTVHSQEQGNQQQRLSYATSIPDKDLRQVSAYAMNPSLYRQVDSFANRAARAPDGRSSTPPAALPSSTRAAAARSGPC